jgi:hypothetical protein
MFKKLGWIFVAVYTAAMLYLTITSVINSGSGNAGIGATIFSIVLFLIPAGVIAFELLGKKVPVIITIAALLFTAIMFLGVIKFNSMSLDTIAKVVLFGITILLLGYFGYKRIFKK